jgi:AbiV family abortive infection protein
MKTPSMPSSKLSAEEMWASRTAIFKSAERLFLDAKLLLENDRCASAYSLAVLALEEIGKLLLDIWDASSKSPKKKAPSNLHRSKQSAVASLLLADYLVKTHGRRIMIEGVTEELVELTAKELKESDAGKFTLHVDVGVVDKIKQLGLYYDDGLVESGLNASRINHYAVTDMFDKVRAAVKALAESPEVVDIGGGIYRLFKK